MSLIRIRTVLRTLTSLKLFLAVTVVGSERSQNTDDLVYPESRENSRITTYQYYTDPPQILKRTLEYNPAFLSENDHSHDGFGFRLSKYQISPVNNYNNAKYPNSLESRLHIPHDIRREEGSSKPAEAESGNEEKKKQNMLSIISLNEMDTGNGKESENLSPIEDALKNITSLEQIIPIVNDLTLITLILLHLPAIVPTILIPLAFFGVGALLIPFVRVNYFINHKDDGEDGRSVNSFGHIISSIYEKMW